MSTATTTRPTKRSFRIQPGAILIFGVVLVPMLLALALNSYGELTDAGAVRMAFGTVAGATLGIVSALAAAALVIVRRSHPGAIVGYSVFAVLVIMWGFGSMASAADLLLSRLTLQ